MGVTSFQQSLYEFFDSGLLFRIALLQKTILFLLRVIEQSSLVLQKKVLQIKMIMIGKTKEKYLIRPKIRLIRMMRIHLILLKRS